MRHPIVRFLSLKSSQRWQVLQAIALLPLTTLGLKVFGFKGCFNRLRQLAERIAEPPPAKKAKAARQTRKVMQLAVKLAPYKGACLSRSLTLWWLLRRQGIESELRIGARKNREPDKSEIDIHAWLEYQGKPLNESRKALKDFVPFKENFTISYRKGKQNDESSKQAA